jgi:hypothetical protein
MSTTNPSPDPLAGAQDDLMSALFAALVMQQTNMALVMLGRLPGAGGEAPPVDLEAARMFIDQLEMLEFKTRGNLSSVEEKLLRQNLATVRMAFVEAAERPPEAAKPPAAAAESHVPAPDATTPAPDSPAEESRKKFTKKY